MKLYLLIFFISIALSNNSQTYSLINNYVPGKIVKELREIIMEMEVPGMGAWMMGSTSTTETSFIKKDEGLLIFNQIVTDMVATQTIWGKTSANHSLNELVNIPYQLSVNPEGQIEKVNSDSKGFEEALTAMVNGVGSYNLIYPYGKNATNISVGDTWTNKQDSIIFYAGEDDAESLMHLESTYVLKKIKEKKGVKIAIIEENIIMTCEMNILQGSIFMQGKMTGEASYKNQFDIKSGTVLLRKGSGNYNYSFNMDDKVFKSNMIMTEKLKQRK